MFRKIFAGLFLLSLASTGVAAQSCGPYPNTLTNGQPADANQVMANFNSILNCLNNILALPGYLYGLTLANNISDPTNDIDIASGRASSTEASPAMMVLASTLTKRLDAAWAVGTNQGGLDTGSVADGTYHVWLIQRSDTSVVDALFSLNASSPTMPANYDRKRRIGSIARASSAIRGFTQRGDVFLWNAAATDRSSTAATGWAALSLTVPNGILVRPIIGGRMGSAGPGATQVLTDIADGNQPSNPTSYIRVAELPYASDMMTWNSVGPFFTNAARQIYIRVVVLSGSVGTNSLETYGWIDRRGQDN